MFELFEIQEENKNIIYNLIITRTFLKCANTKKEKE